MRSWPATTCARAGYLIDALIRALAVHGAPLAIYLDLLTKKHREQLSVNTRGIDYHKISRQRLWAFHDFAKTIADLLGKKGGLSDFTAHELESLKKTHNQSAQITKPLIKEAFARALKPELPYIIFEIKTLIKKKGNA